MKEGRIITALLICASLLSGCVSVPFSKEETDIVDTTETTESTTSEEASDDISTSAQTEATTEKQSEGNTEGKIESGGAMSVDYAIPYLKVLQDNKINICSYSQERQKLGNVTYDDGYYYTYDYNYDYEENTPIALSDITGDGVPELIMIVNVDYDADFIADLYIYTVKDGRALEICHEEGWDNKVQSGVAYSLFQIEGESTLYACNGVAPESDTYESYYRFDVQADGTLVKTELMEREHMPVLDYLGNEERTNCTIAGETASNDEFQTQLNTIIGKMSKLLMYNKNAYNINTNEAMQKAGQCYMSYEEAIESLSQKAGVEVSAYDNLPFDEAQKFEFMSGAGGWSTEVTLNSSGEFDGYYHDSNIGDMGDGYDFTMYVCTFHGKFKNITKIDDYTYSMDLDYINIEDTESQEWIATIDDGRRVRYIAADPYGMEDGEKYYLYAPGISVDKLPSGFVSWVYGLSNKSTLDTYGLYNVKKEYGFSVLDND